ncbi:MAG: hypothetical protein ABSE21_18495 [Bryobacteraceae bacterium]
MDPFAKSTVLLVLLIPGIWLIASGLPRTIGLNKLERRSRRRRWYVLVGLGFVVFLIATIALNWFHLFMVSTVLMLLYWYAWTWISWLIADRWIRNRIVRDGTPDSKRNDLP